MHYADKVIELLGAYPGRAFRMADIVRYLDARARCARDKQRLRKGALRALTVLEETGVVEKRARPVPGSFAIYRWKSETSSHCKSATQSNTLGLG
jgi:hypothetical protein